MWNGVELRRRYDFSIFVNSRAYSGVVIDPHYQIRHFKSMNDHLILKLMKEISGRNYLPTGVSQEGWEIYVNDPVMFENKLYRVIWCSHTSEDYLGVINAFRRTRQRS